MLFAYLLMYLILLITTIKAYKAFQSNPIRYTIGFVIQISTSNPLPYE